MPQKNHRRLWGLASATTLTIEGVTILARVLAGQSAAEFNRTADPPFLLKIHHMFWAVPLILAALVAPRWKVADVNRAARVARPEHDAGFRADSHV